MSNPSLSDPRRDALIKRLMDARRALRDGAPAEARAHALAQVDAAEGALGERGPVWWANGAPDYNRKLAMNTPCADWFSTLPKA